MKTLVLGLGNPILSDDRVGFCVVQQLKPKISKPDLKLVASSASGLSLLDLIIGYDKLIVIDAIQTEGGEAGKIYRLGAENLGAVRHPTSPHDINLATALELGRKSGAPLPQQITIFAIEAVDVTTVSEKCSPEVDKVIPVVVDMVAEELDIG